MCGIAGILFKHAEDGLETGKALIDMLDGCQHRGPDSTGFALYGAEHADELRLRFFVGEGAAAADAIRGIKAALAAHQARIVGKEALVGGFNGLLFAVLVGIVAWLWFASPDIGIVIAAAMAINLVVAGLAGVAIPIGLERTGIDPAVASVVLLTTITDVVGFAVFLGLAALFLI